MAIDRRMDKEDVVYIHRVEYYSVIKKNEIMPFAATWMDLEIIILSQVNQKEKDKYHISLLYMESKTQMNLSTKQKYTHRHKEQTCGCQGGGGWGRDRLGVWD